MVQVTKSITVMRPRAEVYEFWRDFRNLPTFMLRLRSVAVEDSRSHWVAAEEDDDETVMEWDAEILDDRPGTQLAWRSAPGGDVHHAGSVAFRDAPGDRGTEVEVCLQYDSPSQASVRLFDDDPARQLADELRRFKQVMEIGEVVRSEGSPEGAGQGVFEQRAAQAPDVEVRQ